MAVMSYTADAGSDPAHTLEQSEAAGTTESSLQKAERRREAYWLRNAQPSAGTLRRRACLAMRGLPVPPGRSILEIGAGSGLWTAHLVAVLGSQNSLTAGAFNEDLARACSARNLPNTRCVHVRDLETAFDSGSFDYIVGTDVLADDLVARVLAAAWHWLKPGGQIVFFGPNASNPLAFLHARVRSWSRQKNSEIFLPAVSHRQWANVTSQAGFTDIEEDPCEVMQPANSSAGQALGLILEHAPVTKNFSRSMSFWATKPGSLPEISSGVNLGQHRVLSKAVSVVVPCHNEEANIPRLVRTLLGLYDDYIQEIVIVDDNSTDGTGKVTATLAASEPRVRLLSRQPPGGVGRALRDGYAAARGKYILSIDGDFTYIAPEFKGLFDAVAAGYDGAIGSRFSSKSALIRYPFLKILSNRAFHWTLNLLLGKEIRDLSNNLKLYRADILKNLDIEEDHFAANAETGLKPLLMGYKICEVPASWINRTPEMGKSSFNLLKVGPDYLRTLLRITWSAWRGRYRNSRA